MIDSNSIDVILSCKFDCFLVHEDVNTRRRKENSKQRNTRNSLFSFRMISFHNCP
jgi:hypothetical protein